MTGLIIGCANNACDQFIGKHQGQPLKKFGLPLVAIALSCLLLSSAALASGNATRGEYMVLLGGCHSCHTDTRNRNEPLAGGVALTTPFGTFHVPNITPDSESGIGRWSDNDFIRAMTEGIAPDGNHYYPAFPYTSYTRMTRQDLLDLKAYLNTVKPVHRKIPPHNLRFPYNFRAALGIWKFLFFRKGGFKPDSTKSALLNRGAYIVTGPAHCGECHTRRNFLGATVRDDSLAGIRKGPDGGRMPNITPHPKEGIGLWSATDMISFLKTGVPPFGEDVGDPMDKVITNSTSKWTDDDLKAVTEYLRSLPARPTP